MTDTIVEQPLVTAAPVLLPAINLLPAHYRVQRTFRRAAAGSGAAVLAAIIGVGFLAHAAASSAHREETRRDAAVSDVGRLQRRAATFVPVTKAYQDVDTARATLRAALGEEVRFSRFFAALGTTIPATVQITTLTVAQSGADVPGAAAGAITGPVVGLPPVASPIGSLAVSGVAGTHPDVASWLDAISRQRGIGSPYLSASTRAGTDGRPYVKFDSTAVLSGQLLSGRYSGADGGLR